MFGHINGEEQQRQGEIKVVSRASRSQHRGKGIYCCLDFRSLPCLIPPPHSAPDNSSLASSHSEAMEASTYTFHAAFRVQNLQVQSLSL